MGARSVLAFVAFLSAGSEAPAMAPLYDPVVLNIGISCQWQQSCERRQRKAMTDAAEYIAATHPPLWRIHLCNRNAGRSRDRVDWIGFNACIRNPALTPPRRHRRR
jgi:hypothetical protein